ncbi:MAG: hypothetical protein ACP5IL_06405 [Syntrophobacteraceae bacterium]
MGSASIESFMNRHGISMQLMKMDSAKSTGRDRHKAVERYRCQMRRLEKKIDVYVEAPCPECSLSVCDVLFLLVLDASGCEMFKDYYGRREEFHEMLSELGQAHDQFDEFWVEYESRRRQSLKLKSFLGSSLYDTLMERFGVSN